MNDFVTKHWDKLISLALGALGGFLTAWLSIESRVSTVALELREVKTLVESSIQPETDKIDGISSESEALRRDVDKLVSSDRFVQFVQDRIERDLKEVRIETIKELTELIQEARTEAGEP